MTDRSSEFITRRAHGLVGTALGDTRVVLINGARQAGKSTLAEMVSAGSPGSIICRRGDPLL